MVSFRNRLNFHAAELRFHRSGLQHKASLINTWHTPLLFHSHGEPVGKGTGSHLAWSPDLSQHCQNFHYCQRQGLQQFSAPSIFTRAKFLPWHLTGRLPNSVCRDLPATSAFVVRFQGILPDHPPTPAAVLPPSYCRSLGFTLIRGCRKWDLQLGHVRITLCAHIHRGHSLSSRIWASVHIRPLHWFEDWLKAQA